MDFLWFSSTISFLFLLRLLARHYSRRLPPGPRRLPIIGNLFDLGDKPHVSLARLARTHGPVMSLHLGSTRTVVVSSPDMAREVLQKNDANFSGRLVPDSMRGFQYSETSVIWLPAGERWTSLRRACSTYLFHPQRLNESQPLRRLKIQELISHVSEKSAEGLPVDVKEAASDLMFSLLSCTLLSVDLAKYPSGRELKDAMMKLVEEAVSPNVSDFFPILASFDLQGRRRRAEALSSKIFGMIDEQIHHRLAAAAKEEASERKDFLSSLLQSSVDTMDRQAVKSLIADLFLAGIDASSTTVEWAMSEMLRNPAAMAKVRAELEAVIGSANEVEESDIARLPYLQAVVKETLRLHPTVPLLVPHRAEKAAELGGYVIPENTSVIVNAWAICRDEAVWPNADQFIPERYSGVDVDVRGHHFELIPFGSGRRICPGLPLAYQMVHLMLAAFVRPFEWRLAEGREVSEMDMTERFGITMTKAEPLRAVPVPVAV